MASRARQDYDRYDPYEGGVIYNRGMALLDSEYYTRLILAEYGGECVYNIDPFLVIKTMYEDDAAAWQIYSYISLLHGSIIAIHDENIIHRGWQTLDLDHIGEYIFEIYNETASVVSHESNTSTLTLTETTPDRETPTTHLDTYLTAQLASVVDYDTDAMSIVTSSTVTTVVYDAVLDEMVDDHMLENQMEELNIGNDPAQSDSEDPEDEEQDCTAPISTPSPASPVPETPAPHAELTSPPSVRRISRESRTMSEVARVLFADDDDASETSSTYSLTDEEHEAMSREYEAYLSMLEESNVGYDCLADSYYSSVPRVYGSC